MNRAYTQRNHRRWQDPEYRKRMLVVLKKARAVLASKRKIVPAEVSR